MAQHHTRRWAFVAVRLVLVGGAMLPSLGRTLRRLAELPLKTPLVAAGRSNLSYKRRKSSRLASTPTTLSSTLAQQVEQQLEILDAADKGAMNTSEPMSRVAVVSMPEVFVANDGQARQLFDNGVVLPLGWTGASIRRRTGARLEPSSGALGIGSSSWPVGDPAANPKPRGVFSTATWMTGIKDDLKRRSKFYVSDWIDGFKAPGKMIGAIAFLYFAVMAPAVAFGGIMFQVTGGMLGPRDVIMSCGISGMAYSCISGQPMTFPAPTGLTLSFIGALSGWTDRVGKLLERLLSLGSVWGSVRRLMFF